MTVFSDYIELTKQYKKEYGPHTVILYQVGQFYEMYSIDDSLINLKEITEILNGIKMTCRDKSKPQIDSSNYNMAGVPIFTLNKNLKLLTAANYTVVIVNEIITGSKIIRKVSEIISPGTNLIDVNPFTTNMLLIAHLEEFQTRKQQKTLLAIGACFVDLTSGKSYVGEFISTESDQSLALDELYKFIIMHSPREVVLMSTDKLMTTEYDKLVANLDLANIYVHNRLEKVASEMTKISYQDQLLRKIFPNHGLLSPHEYLDLERTPLAALAFVFALDFCYKHNDSALHNISKPTELLSNTDCTIAYNAANQLNMSALEKILNKCRTAIGRRAFKERFMSPLTDQNKLNKQYDKLDIFIQLANKPDIQAKLIKGLDDIYDVERLYRFICARKLNPSDISQITTTIQAIRALNKLGKETHFSKVGSARRLYDELIITINLDMARKYNISTIEENFFINGIYPELDDLQLNLNTNKGVFQQVANALHSDYFKVEYTERDGYSLNITKCRYNSIKNQLEKKRFILNGIEYNWKDFTMHPNKTTYKCVSPQLQSVNNKIAKEKIALCEQVRTKYLEYLDKIGSEYMDLFYKMAQYISEIDWLYSCAKNAIEYRYVRPTIKKNGEESYIYANDLRHPIVEQILIHEKYVPNNIQLGGKTNSGILLYGVNSSGKSCLGKSVALSVIMAQVGMFVPATKFIYWPYNHIFTRIPTGDDIMNGQSTFVVELNELGNILKRATVNSLVIGDELCSGTEEPSALSIVGSGISQLCARKTSFIFATHLHKLPRISTIATLINNNYVQLFHLSVVHDKDNDRLIYQRKLITGQGSCLYGLEVCKAVISDIEFLNMASVIRHEVLEQSADLCIAKKSRYNGSVYVDICTICGKKAQEIHHIEQQMLADINGYIGHIHKNNKSNLIAICEKCHDSIHLGKLKVDGFKQTTNGIELILNK